MLVFLKKGDFEFCNIFLETFKIYMYLDTVGRICFPSFTTVECWLESLIKASLNI